MLYIKQQVSVGEHNTLALHSKTHMVTGQQSKLQHARVSAKSVDTDKQSIVPHNAYQQHQDCPEAYAPGPACIRGILHRHASLPLALVSVVSCACASIVNTV